jgi:hypothetical protein
LIRRLLKNKKGTAEVIGSVMFIIILLFFFTNVYMWHDAATKEMNDLYVQKINSPITLSLVSANNPYVLNVTNKGGEDAKLSILWIDVAAANTGNPDQFHGYFPDQLNSVVPAGSSIQVAWNGNALNGYGEHYTYQSGDKLQLKVVTTVGNTAACRCP